VGIEGDLDMSDHRFFTPQIVGSVHIADRYVRMGRELGTG
jgi:hypothetical protein